MASHLLSQALVHELAAISAKAAQAVMEIYDKPTLWRVAEKSNNSPLTQADLESSRIICEALAKIDPAIPILSEESPWRGGEAATYWAVDPLDGTKEFLKRNGEFTVNIGLIVDGIPQLGLICAPTSKTIWAGIKDEAKDSGWAASTRFESFDQKDFADGGWKNISVAGAQEEKAPQRLRLLGSRSHGSDDLPDWLMRILRGASTIERGSSLKFCLIAQGDADVYVRMGPTSIWDTAAGQAILTAAGGVVADLSSLTELSYSNPSKTLNPSFLAYVPNRITFPG